MDPKQDTFNESVSTIIERKVRGWLSGVIDDMRRSSPVQQWLDSLPTEPAADLENSSDLNSNEETLVKTAEVKSDDSRAEETVTENTVIEPIKETNTEDQNLDVPNVSVDAWKRKSLDSGLLTSTPQRGNIKRLQRDHSVQSEGYTPKFKNPLFRDHSLQSDASGSSGSSVLNVLGARKVDAESVLLALGFGPSEKQQKLQRIPDRFLVPSKLKGISTEDFIKNEHHSMRMHDCGIFGYRGLTGNPHVPPSTIVAKIIGCILQDEVCREEALIKARHSIADMRTQPNINAILAARLRHN
ncbi:ki-ras-induced actin-interacting protein-IP3R-interacting domain olf186-M isoform X1 [Anticarsia gemmatalis]|uniref:ki-ras-induced actin-interacting protein-IP3R-interacting domain olf186-M isoform X1 n=2 Tax=Anticarsia gemmatalis TaxID=129554 RepID=UPI003F7749DD